MSMVRRQSSGEISSTPAVGPAMPALLISPSRPPSEAFASTKKRSTSDSLETSALVAPWPGWAFRKSARNSSETSHTWIRAPCPISMSAMARPIPEAPAETTTRKPGLRPSTHFFPASSAIFVLLGLFLAQRHDRRQHDQAKDDDPGRIRQRRSRKQRLQGRQQKHAADHAQIAAAAAGDQS